MRFGNFKRLLFQSKYMWLWLVTPAWALAADAAVRISTPMEPPTWARLERRLLAENAPACREFFKRYFDERGYLQCFVRWGGQRWAG